MRPRLSSLLLGWVGSEERFLNYTSARLGNSSFLLLSTHYTLNNPPPSCCPRYAIVDTPLEQQQEEQECAQDSIWKWINFCRRLPVTYSPISCLLFHPHSRFFCCASSSSPWTTIPSKSIAILKLLVSPFSILVLFREGSAHRTRLSKRGWPIRIIRVPGMSPTTRPREAVRSEKGSAGTSQMLMPN